MTAPRFVRFLVPPAIVGLGILLFIALMSLREDAEKTPPEYRVSKVEVFEPQQRDQVAIVRLSGVVEGERQVRLSSLVAGPVIYASDKLVPGGRFGAGETILQVDPRDYELSVTSEQSRLRQAELELELEQERSRVAAREWELLGSGRDPGEAPLALRRSQLEAVQQKVTAARSGLRGAQLSLERTTLRSPFNSMVIEESGEEGQLLSPGSPVVTLVGTDRFRVRGSVPVAQVARMDFAAGDALAGSRARVWQDLDDGTRTERLGRVLQLAGQLDPTTRTAEVYVGIDAPLEGDGPPLLPGAFVTVTVFGRTIPGAFALPRDVLVDGNGVWTVTPEDTLSFREVSIGWLDDAFAFIVGGLEPGSRVVLTPPALPIDGAQVEPMTVAAPPSPAPVPASLLAPEPQVDPPQPDLVEPETPAASEG